MSATGRSDVRHPDDFYATPKWCVDALWPHIRYQKGDVILDPCAGTGAIIDALQDRPTLVVARGIEIDTNRREECHYTTDAECELGDALVLDWKQPAIVVMNPPYSLAMEFVVRAIGMTNGGCVAALLRLPWLASRSRASFHRAFPSDVLVLSRRPEFCMSCSCGARPKCGWAETRKLTAERPRTCEGCAGKVQVSTTDATDYAWFLWGRDHGNRWSICDTPV